MSTDDDDDSARTQTRPRARSHQEYLDSLVLPSAAELARISDIQVQKEQEILRRYHKHSIEEQDAAKLIQRTYRGHRARRQLSGLTLDPTSRWVELVKEWRYRSATAPHRSSVGSSDAHPGLTTNPSHRAMVNWRRVRDIADHAGAGEDHNSLATQHTSLKSSLRPQSSVRPWRNAWKSSSVEPESMLLDLRYFLEMVDHKHRYGANLQVYHEEWQHTNTDENFFYWLDHGEGRDLDLVGCDRRKLEAERIRYLSREERQQYLVRVDSDGLLRWQKDDELITTSIDQYQDSMYGIVSLGASAPTFDDEDVKRQIAADASLSSKLAAVGGIFRNALKPEPDFKYAKATSASSSWDSPCISVANLADESAVHQTATSDSMPKKERRRRARGRLRVSPATILNRLLRASVRPGTWIYVSDTVGRLYVGIKASGSFQHASFLSGSRISSAGTIGIDQGRLTYLSPLSGHYRPTTKSFRRFIANLRDQGVDTSHLKVSKAYHIVRGMEFYEQSKKATKRLFLPVRHEREATVRLAPREGDCTSLQKNFLACSEAR